MDQSEQGMIELPGNEAVLQHLARRTFLRSLALMGGGLFAPGLWADAPEFHTVRSGDTLTSIAQRHGISLPQLRSMNNLAADTIYAGQKLRLRANKQAYTRLKPVISRIDAPKVSAGHWKNIIVHHSGTDFGSASSFDRYHRQQRHMENGLAYHFVIGNGTQSRNGQVEVGGRWKNQLPGGHVATESYNQNSIGICLVGNFEVKKPSALQLEAARQLITYLRSHVLDRNVHFLVHKDIEKTLCPGKYFPLRDFRKMFG